MHLLFHDWVLDTMRRVATQTFYWKPRALGCHGSFSSFAAGHWFLHLPCRPCTPAAVLDIKPLRWKRCSRSSKGDLWTALLCVKALYHHLAIFTSPVNPFDSAVAASRLRCVKCTGSMLSSDLVLVAGPISGIAVVLRRRARTFGVILCNTMTCRYSFQNSMVSIPMCFAGLDKFVMIVKRSDMKTFSQRRTFILYKGS